MKLDGAGDGPPNRDESNNYSRQMAELVRREKQAKKRQVRIYIQNVFENCNFYNLIFFLFQDAARKRLEDLENARKAARDQKEKDDAEKR